MNKELIPASLLAASTATRPLPRPSFRLLASEPFRAAGEYVQHKLSPRRQPNGDGHPVILFPGLAANASSMATLRDACRSLGYAAVDWGRGLNTGPRGDIDTWLADLAGHVSTLLADREKPATLIGWSLGGLYARELGKLLAPRVRQVITIGTPFNAEAGSTHVGWLFRLLSGRAAGVNPALSLRLRTPPPVPTTSIYSRMDGVVAWQSCLHEQSGRHVEDIEVPGSHIGMVWNNAVLRVVEDRLLQRPGQWRAYASRAHGAVIGSAPVAKAIKVRRA